MKGWNGWCHVMGSTYGQWLRGDPRGWRARHHREHCEGDYRHRPDPNVHRAKYELSKSLMERDPVRVEASLRETVARAIADKLRELDCKPVIAVMGSKHMHVLAQFVQHDPRIKVGIAKFHATQTLKAHCSAVGINLHLERGEGIWAKRSKAEPIKDRSHQVQAFYYIVRHVREDAALWLEDDLESRRNQIISTAFKRRR